MTSTTTSPSLLESARDGETVAWQRMVALYGPMIYRWCRHAGLQGADASDVTQDTLLSVHRDLHRFSPDVSSGSFRGWLWTITKRRLADHIRHNKQGCEVSLHSNEAGRSEEVDEPPTDASSDTIGVLNRAVALSRDQFEESTWQAFQMVVVEGRDPAQVAELLGVTRWTVYKARARVLKRLRQELRGLIEE